ncbi:MAG: tRNA (adenosine(37)-N6)-threonylcarbamoyltransferase complex transferase subunit TsaD [Patescibacteria group bacterium]|nr:tRNA (adenosine(37)-N6)-threonylcarbamoyltransferase complex transferase subunit TsaD [Patescibacteria group bacterium]
MIIFSIETSCDDTSVALVKNGTEVLGVLTSSQVDLHKKYGGVVPEVASRQHLQTILPLIDELFEVTNFSKDDVDAIAVTNRPGLLGSLLVGVNTAKTLAYLWEKPLIAVDHLLAHIYSNLLESDFKPEWPLLALVVSGGHSGLYLINDWQDVVVVGETRDDAVGEAFDKAAKILGLGYPGGPAISKLAKAGDIPKLPRPMLDEGLDMSFSGLKTALLKVADDYPKENLAHEFQEAATDVLKTKTARAIRHYKPSALLLAGGVAANTVLRTKLEEVAKKYKIKYFQPELKYCMDNAAMVGAAAYFLRSSKIDKWQNAKVSSTSDLHT